MLDGIDESRLVSTKHRNKVKIVGRRNKIGIPFL